LETIERCIELGAANYIRKDTPIEEIRQTIRETWQTFLEGARRWHPVSHPTQTPLVKNPSRSFCAGLLASEFAGMTAGGGVLRAAGFVMPAKTGIQGCSKRKDSAFKVIQNQRHDADAPVRRPVLSRG